MTIYIIDLEPVESRYTAQWKKFIPQELQRLTNDKVITISGGDVPQTTTPGAFLNFAGTNVYKSQQSIDVAKLFDSKVKYLPRRAGERYASALTNKNLSNKIYKYFGKVSLKKYIKDFIKNN